MKHLGKQLSSKQKSLSHDSVVLISLDFKHFFLKIPLLTSSSSLYSHLFERHSSILEYSTSQI